MLALTKKTEYALIALTHLARHEGRSVSAREIADHYRVPLSLLMNILKTLTQRGLARSIRGARGGYILAVPACELTLDEIIRAVEGPVCLTQCVAETAGAPRGTCEVKPACPVRSPVHKVNEKVKDLLGRVSLADLMDDRVCAEVVSPAAAGA